MASVPQTVQRFCWYLGGPREHPHDWTSPAVSELIRGAVSCPQSHRHRAARYRLPSAASFCTSRMTVSLPYLSPGLTECLTLRTVSVKTGIQLEPRRQGRYDKPDNTRAELGRFVCHPAVAGRPQSRSRTWTRARPAPATCG